MGLVSDAAVAGAEAADLIGRAAARDKRNPTYRLNLGLTLARQGQRAEALKLAPGNVDALFNGAVVLQQMGRFDDAESRLHRVLSVQSAHLPALNNLSNLLRRRGAMHEAAAILNRAVKAAPDSFEPRFNLTRLLNTAGEHEAALPHARACVKARPDMAEAQAELAVALTHSGDYKAGLAAYDEALRLKPGSADALTNKGLALMESGRADESDAALAQALEITPHHAAAHFNRSLAVRGPDEDGLLAVQAAVDSEGIPPAAEALLRFAEGNRLQAAGRYDEAFAAFAHANALVENGYDAAEAEKATDALILTFDAAWFAARAGKGSDSERPVFIVGMPRSGTSLVEQILASHPAVFGAGERRTFNMVPLALPGFAGVKTPYPDCMTAVTADHIKRLAGQIEAELKKLSPGTTRVADKLPGNFLHLGLIRTLFPNATIIHCRRDPVDTCLSCFNTRFQGRVRIGYALEDLAHFYGQ